MNKRKGFTIIELLIVIVVIAVLAAISLVVFNGVQQRARVSSLNAGLRQISKAVSHEIVLKGNPPASINNLIQPGSGSSDPTYTYSITDSASSPAKYCLEGALGNTKYRTDNTGIITMGECTVTPPLVVDTTIVPSGTDSPGFEQPAQAFDGSSATKWLLFSPTAWVVFAVQDALAPTGYTLTSANDSQGRDPKNWTLYGSNDRSNWTPIDTRSNEVFPSRFMARTFTITGSSSYRHFKLDIVANAGDTVVQIAEISINGATIVRP